MVPLKTRGTAVGIDEPVLGPVSFGRPLPGGIRVGAEQGGSPAGAGWAAVVSSGPPADPADGVPRISNVRSVDHLSEGDIVALHPSGLVETLFRAESQNNALFVTDRCNSNCLMCSQPPRDVDDIDPLDAINRRLIPLIPKDTLELGITGGEPTLLGWRLPRLLAQLRDELPETAVHMLTNGRAFAWERVARAVASVGHPDLVLGVPLYADHAALHDYVVQARDAFSQTVLGLHALGRRGVRVEVRVVLHALTVARLPEIAEFVFRHLPFAEHVAFMGLEYTGYTPHNSGVLWTEPSEMAGPLEEAVGYLDAFGMNVSLYNLQHCVTPRALWPFLRPSISAWKRDYLPACEACTVQSQCGGVFGTSKRFSDAIRPVL